MSEPKYALKRGREMIQMHLQNIDLVRAGHRDADPILAKLPFTDEEVIARSEKRIVDWTLSIMREMERGND